MDYQGSVYYYDGYSNFMKGKSQFYGENLEADSGARRDWFVGYRHAMADHHCRVKRELDNVAHQFDSTSQQFESLAGARNSDNSLTLCVINGSILVQSIPEGFLNDFDIRITEKGAVIQRKR